MNDTTDKEVRPRTGIGSRLYELILGIPAGFSLGWFAWLVGDRLMDDVPPLWPFATGGVVLTYGAVRWARRRHGEGVWVHLLWIPVIAFVGLMTLIVMALRAWGG